MALDKNLFSENLFFVFNNCNNFNKIKPNQTHILVEYFLIMQNLDNKIKMILNELINLSRGINEPDFIVHCEMEIVMMKKKMNMN